MEVIKLFSLLFLCATAFAVPQPYNIELNATDTFVNFKPYRPDETSRAHHATIHNTLKFYANCPCSEEPNGELSGDTAIVTKDHYDWRHGAEIEFSVHTHHRGMCAFTISPMSDANGNGGLTLFPKDITTGEEEKMLVSYRECSNSDLVIPELTPLCAVYRIGDNHRQVTITLHNSTCDGKQTSNIIHAATTHTTFRQRTQITDGHLMMRFGGARAITNAFFVVRKITLYKDDGNGPPHSLDDTNTHFDCESGFIRYQLGPAHSLPYTLAIGDQDRFYVDESVLTGTIILNDTEASAGLVKMIRTDHEDFTMIFHILTHTPTVRYATKEITCSYPTSGEGEIDSLPVSNSDAFSMSMVGEWEVVTDICLGDVCGLSSVNVVDENVELTLKIKLNTAGSQTINVGQVVGISDNDRFNISNPYVYYVDGNVDNGAAIVHSDETTLVLYFRANSLVNRIIFSYEITTPEFRQKRSIIRRNTNSLEGTVDLPRVLKSTQNTNGEGEAGTSTDDNSTFSTYALIGSGSLAFIAIVLIIVAVVHTRKRGGANLGPDDNILLVDRKGRTTI